MDVFPVVVPNVFAAAFTAWVAALAVGLAYLLEHRFFNDKVFWAHTFPEIVPDLPPGKSAAFWAGYRVTWKPYLAWRLVSVLIGFRIMPVPTHFLFLLGCGGVMIADKLTEQKVRFNPHYYHEWFYTLGVAAEVIWIAYAHLI